MSNAETLVQEVTNLLINNGCSVNHLAMIELAIYITEREKKAIKELAEVVHV